MKGTFHVTSSASAVFPLTQDPALGGLLALGTQDTEGAQLAVSSLHTELLPAGLELGQKKLCKQQSVMSQRRKGSD